MTSIFRARLLATIREIRPLLLEPDVMVVGSEVPNLLAPEGTPLPVVSKDIDLAVSPKAHARIKQLVGALEGLRPSEEEPSVLVPVHDGLLELNLVGWDPAFREPTQCYVLEDPDLPILVFGTLSRLRPGPPASVEGFPVPLPRLADLIIEKLLTDRGGVKGERDLLVALALLDHLDVDERREIEILFAELGDELRHAVRSNLAILSLLSPLEGMPDPRPKRALVASLLDALESRETGS